MKRLNTLTLCIIVLAVFLFNNARAQQVFSISEIDASEFPKVSASFVALDGSGNSYPDLKPSDFSVIDMGINVSSTISVDCIDSLVDPAVSVILILDKSQSMNYTYESGEKRWDWVKEGATSFINTMNLTNGSKIGMIAFSKLANIVCPFTDSKSELLDSLNLIKVAGGTEYDPPILDYRAGAVQMFKIGSPDTKKRRIAIFLTDGEPNHDPSVDSMKKELSNANIQLYAITVGMPMNTDLENVANSTGGSAYAVFTKEELNNIYKYIAIDIQRKQICTLSWLAPFGCSDVSRYRNVQITFKIQNSKLDKHYEAPPNAVATVELSEPFVEFGNPDANLSVDRMLTITARNSDFYVTDANIMPSTYFQIVDWDVNAGAGADPPFLLKKDSSRTIMIRFTQGANKLYRQASLVFEGTPCPPTVQLIGGITQIKIIHPNGGELFSTCDTVEIQWAGVEANKPVNLSYSTNDGQNWVSIANNVRGLSYLWKPPSAGTQYRVRAVVAPVSNYKWAKSIGGSENDNARSVAVTKDNLYLYVTGSFSGTVDFGTRTIQSRGATDIYLAKFDTDGNLIWVETAGSNGYDSSNAVCVDDAGNAYITGVCYEGVKFGNITPNIPVAGLPNCFVARYAPNGGTPAIALIGANPIYNTFQAGGTRIRFREAEKEVDVRGIYLNEVQSPNGYSLPKVTQPTPFTAVFRADLSYGPVNRGGPIYPDYSKNYAIDSDGNRYTVGSFTDNIRFGAFELTSNGQGDIYINKYGGTPGSEDISDSSFSVISPVITFTNNFLVFEETMLGVANDTIIERQLCNIGALPVEISGYSFSGANPNDFILTSNPVSVKLKPGECIPLEISFQPTDIGYRAAQLVISATCTQDIYMDMSGVGVCGGEAVSEIDFGRVNMSSKKDSVITCLFKNTNPTTVTVKPNLTGPDAGDFSVSQSSYFVEPDSCLTLTVSFTPSAPGIRNAAIEFRLPEGCINPVTELKGEGISTDLTVNSIHWGEKRVLTSNDSAVVINNASVLPATIDSIKFETPPGSEFTVLNLPSMPYVLPANDSLVLQVNFTPPDEMFYSSILNIYAQGISTPLTATLDGSGILPKISARWECDTATIPGDTSVAYLIIDNPSETAELKVFSVLFRYNNPDFEWADGTAPSGFTVPKQGSDTINVLFIPHGAGTRANVIEISHDAAPGPETEPVADTTVDALCDGLGLIVTDSLNFKGVLICDDYTLELRLENTSWQTPISITDAQITGADADNFTVDFAGPIEVPPGNFRTLYVTFAPDVPRQYYAVLTLKTSVGYDINVYLQGIGEYLYYTAAEEEYKNEPGYPIKIPVSLRVNELNKQTVPQLKLQVTYNDKMLRYDKVDFVDFPEWTWDTPELINPGLLEISGSGNLQTPFNGKVFEIQWTVFLADVKESSINLKPIMEDCPTVDTTVTNVKYSPFCFMDGRLVVTNSTNYFLKAPDPNPVTDNAVLTFGLGLDGHTTIELYNSMGQKVKSFVNETLKSGKYELLINTNEFTSGNYFIVLRSGHIVKTIKFIVNK